MLARRDRFCGNILLYDYLYTKRSPVILNRNLIRAFQIHHLILSSNTEGDLGADHSLRSKWRPPSWDELDDMVAVETANGSFFLNIKSIKLHDRQHSARDGGRHARARKARVLLRAKSAIRASFFPDASQVCRTRLTENALLKANDRGIGGTASIDMEPFIIKHQSLALSSSHITLGKSYLMELRLTFHSKDEAEQFYDYMGVRNVAGNPLQLVTVYDNILDCPSGSTVLQLRDHTKQIVFDLEVCMWWANTVSESILERSNRAMRNPEEHARLYITPPLDVDRQPRLQIRFLFGNRVFQKSSLVCPLGGCRVGRLADIKDLKMHLDSFHDYFRFTATRERVDDQGVEHWRFEVEIADHRADRRASDRADEPMDVHVHAPEHPFDRELHLRGNTRFHQLATQKHPPKYTEQRGRQVTSTTQLPLRRKPPEDVQARPARSKKTYIVPDAPQGITFFRSVTKQPLQAGDEISESDDELDLDWMQLRKHAETDREDISESAKHFQKTFDDYMQDENLQADVHASDAIVRFTREKGDWVSANGVFEELSTKLGELLEDGIISKDVHTACLEIVRPPRTDAQATDEALQKLGGLQVQPEEMALQLAGHQMNKQSKAKRDGKGKGKAKVTDTGHLTPLTADSDGDLEMREAVLNSGASMPPPEVFSKAQPAYDECYCGEDALYSFSASPVIACNKVDCIRRHFHIQCVQSHTQRLLPSFNPKRRDWTCDDCNKTSSTRN